MERERLLKIFPEIYLLMIEQSGTQKMLLAELERLEIANLKLETKYEEIGNKLEEYKDMYHKCDKDKAV